MRDKDLYAAILGVETPWVVTEVELRGSAEEVEVHLAYDPKAPLHCPTCGGICGRHDTRRRSWRHLDTCQFKTMLTAEVPRVNCPCDGVLQINVPWAERGSRFTAMFESLAIDWLQEASVSAVSRRLRITWDALDGILQRAVLRGLARRSAEPVSRLGVDETAYQKRHEYVTVVNDLDRGRVLYVADDRTESSLGMFFASLTAEQLSGIEAVAMDMWKPYMKATRTHVSGWETKICFDRFHVSKHLGEAVNMVRKREHRERAATGDTRLKGTRHLWLMGPPRRRELSAERRREFDTLRSSTLKVARAWAMKEMARGLWAYSYRGWAEKGWQRWLGWASRSRLAPMQRAGAMVKEHLWGIINAVVKGVTNATSESLNAKIQRVKKNACGYRNRERFRMAIYFHCGGLDLYPRPSSHPKA